METMTRENGTDERLDEFGKRMDERFDRPLRSGASRDEAGIRTGRQTARPVGQWSRDGSAGHHLRVRQLVDRIRCRLRHAGIQDLSRRHRIASTVASVSAIGTVAGVWSIQKKSRSKAGQMIAARTAPRSCRRRSEASRAPNVAAMKRSPKPITAEPKEANWRRGRSAAGAAALRTE